MSATLSGSSPSPSLSRPVGSSPSPASTAPTRQDILFVTARAKMALDLAHPPAARRELERLEAVEGRWSIES
ncbi:hypothetical protein [Streptomyces sp. MUSC 14]|uniref:hypothetical protein n=1 Tax=Streptomyces sp. MUSC 14 TaxID=1354889 RepID=UPI0011601075|nr:hypothetical protein [Streptomyces sp. MUSC 14]